MASTVETTKDNHSQLGQRYKKISLVLFIIGFVYLLWLVIEIAAVSFLNLGFRWSLLSVEEWFYSGWIVFLGLIMIELILFAHYYKTRQTLSEAPVTPLFFKGHRLHVFTYPQSAQGGIFSKTHVKIDEDNIVNVRVQLADPEELWGQSEQ